MSFRTRQDYGLTADSLARLLARLDADPERAGEAYEDLRAQLVRFFIWRGAHFPEDLADETLNRVSYNFTTKQEDILNLPHYCLGVARLVLLEHFRAPDAQRVEWDELPPLVAPALPEPDDDEQRLACLRTCLSSLPNAERALIERYYADEKRAKIDHRKQLSVELGLTPEALRRRAKRTRDKLLECVKRRMQRQPIDRG